VEELHLVELVLALQMWHLLLIFNGTLLHIPPENGMTGILRKFQI
jgi:hypothetical protein